MMDDKLSLIVGGSNSVLGNDIAKHLGITPAKMKLRRFNDGEINLQILENIRGKDVFIVQSTQPPADNLLELLLIIDAAKRASAWRITAVIPYFGYARQERKDRPRVPISAKLVANLLVAAGINRVLTIDLHASAIQGFFDVPTDHLTADIIFRDLLLDEMSDRIKNKELVMVSPDIGGVKRTEYIGDHVGASIAVVYKKRERPNEIAKIQNIAGDVKDKIAVIRDDIIDTGGTLCSACDLIIDEGAKDVIALITHPLLSGAAVENVVNSKIGTLVITDTLPIKENVKQILGSKLRIFSVAPFLAATIESIHMEQSISVLFNKNFLKEIKYEIGGEK
jgi:ribose-phosphate pyrophosphokinase